MAESQGKPTPQSNFIVQNEIVKMAGFLRFSRQHVRATDNETLDLLDDTLKVIEMTEGRRDRLNRRVDRLCSMLCIVVGFCEEMAIPDRDLRFSERRKNGTS